MKKQINGMLVLALIVTAGCSSKSAVTNTAVKEVAPPVVVSPVLPPAPPSLPPALPPAPTGYGFDQWQTGPLGDVFFGFDSSELSAEAQEQLKQNSAWLKNNSAKGAIIEGHCDSRGTSEYNLALGERRAGSAKDYLVRLGAVASRFETVSFGEEKPFASGQNEDAWAKNRRDHFVVK
ncbi:MAG: peptidoglycan-associated lipoprotein Pal [Chlorobium sp.]|nr:MAG: peptidoglycan-associated lipoprotein Pal [Chlorobium sp.]